MSEDEAHDVFAALAISSLLAIVVIVVGGWDHIRCYLPAFPSFRVNDDRSPTPIAPGEFE